MKSICIVVAAVVALVTAIDYHETLDDNFDFGPVVQDPSQLKEHLDCYVNEGPCNDLQESFKMQIQDAIREACARCKTSQKHMGNTLLSAVKRNHPDTYYKKFRQLYDPSGEYFDKFEESVANY